MWSTGNTYGIMLVADKISLGFEPKVQSTTIQKA